MPLGREGHARVAILTVIPEEMDAALDVLGARQEVGTTGVFTSAEALECSTDALPFVVARCLDRSNGPAGDSARNLLEDWRPEVLILTGIAGGICREVSTPAGPALEGPSLGDVVVPEIIHFGDYGKNIGDGFLPRWLPLRHPSSQLIRRHTENLRVNPSSWGESISHLRPMVGLPGLHHGELVAVEAVLGNPLETRQQSILKYFDKATAVDMESMGVARALHTHSEDVHYQPSWICIRGVSDRVVGTDSAAELLAGTDNTGERSVWKAYAATAAATVATTVMRRIVSRARPAYPQQRECPAWPTVGSTT